MNSIVSTSPLQGGGKAFSVAGRAGPKSTRKKVEIGKIGLHPLLSEFLRPLGDVSYELKSGLAFSPQQCHKFLQREPLDVVRLESGEFAVFDGLRLWQIAKAIFPGSEKVEVQLYDTTDESAVVDALVQQVLARPITYRASKFGAIQLAHLAGRLARDPRFKEAVSNVFSERMTKELLAEHMGIRIPSLYENVGKAQKENNGGTNANPDEGSEND